MDEVAIYRLGDGHIDVVARAPRPDTRDLEDLAWTSADELYVSLDDGAVAAVRGDALVPIVMSPDGAWRTAHDADEVHLYPDRSLVGSGHELWQGRCEWGHSDGETSSCDEWAWARLVPAPAIVRHDAPPQEPDRALPAAAAPPGVTFALAPPILRCTIDGRTAEYPPPDARGAGFDRMSGDVRWLSTDPPLATVDELDQAYDGDAHVPVLFEGCTPRAHGAIVVGPDDVLGVKDDGTLHVWWRGRALGTEPADAFAFAPAR